MNKRFILIFILLTIILSGCSFINDLGLSSSKQIEISNYEEFLEISNSKKHKNYILINDITMPDDEYIRYNIGFFNGTLDGNGYQLKNFKVMGEDANYDTLKPVEGIGIFSYIKENGVIKNLVLDNFNLTVNEIHKDIPVGSIAGTLNSFASCIDVTGDVRLIVSSRSEVMYIGGLFGVGYGKINNVDLNVNIDANNNSVCGGLVGKGSTTLNNSSVRGSISGNCVNIGGIIGHAEGTSGSNLFSDVEINAYSTDSYSIGGIIGKYTWSNRYNHSYTNLMSVGPIVVYGSDLSYVGGLIGNIGSNLYIKNVLSLSAIYNGDTYNLVEDDKHLYGALIGKGVELTQVRNGYYCSELGISRAIGSFNDDSLYHFSYSSIDFRNKHELINLDSSMWNFEDNKYPFLKNYNYRGNSDLAFEINSINDFDLLYKKPWAFYELKNDLDYSYDDLNTKFTEIKPFCGVFIGNNHTITNINIIEKTKKISLFKYVSGADISGIKVHDLNISIYDDINLSDGYGFIAYKAKNSNISNIEVIGKVIISTEYANGNFGVLLGTFEGKSKLENILIDSTFAILDFTAEETLEREFNAGGVVGKLTGENQLVDRVIITSDILVNHNFNVITNTVSSVFGQISGENIDITNVLFKPSEDDSLASFRIKHDIELTKFLEIIPLIGDNWDRIDSDIFIVNNETVRLK